MPPLQRNIEGLDQIKGNAALTGLRQGGHQLAISALAQPVDLLLSPGIALGLAVLLALQVCLDELVEGLKGFAPQVFANALRPVFEEVAVDQGSIADLVLLLP